MNKGKVLSRLVWEALYGVCGLVTVFHVDFRKLIIVSDRGRRELHKLTTTIQYWLQETFSIWFYYIVNKLIKLKLVSSLHVFLTICQTNWTVFNLADFGFFLPTKVFPSIFLLFLVFLFIRFTYGNVDAVRISNLFVSFH